MENYKVHHWPYSSSNKNAYKDENVCGSNTQFFNRDETRGDKRYYFPSFNFNCMCTLLPMQY